MSMLFSYFYDSVMDASEQACLQQWREELLKKVSGNVLEIGSGTGANLKFYSSDIKQLILSEPDKNMRKQLMNKTADWPNLNIKVTSSTAEQINADDASFDFVVSALVCCSVVNLDATLNEIKRVLKPGGNLVFMEHVAAKAGTRRRKWQQRLRVPLATVANKPALNRETENAIENAGFIINNITRESMRKAIPVARPTIRGTATKPESSAPV